MEQMRLSLSTSMRLLNILKQAYTQMSSFAGGFQSIAC